MPKSKPFSWKSELSRPPFPSYFRNIEHPTDICFIDFLQKSATSTSCKRDLHHLWIAEIIPALINSEYQVLREVGATLMQRWPVDKQSLEVTRFWQDMEETEAKERHLHALHMGVYERETAVTKSHTKDILLNFADTDRSSKRKTLQSGSLMENKKQARTEGMISIGRKNSDDITVMSGIPATTSSSYLDDSCMGLQTEPQPHFDLDLTRPIKLTLAGFDVGAAFRQLQEEATPFINNESLKVSIKNLHLMLSANSIWDTSGRLPGMSQDVHRSILSEIKPSVIRLSTDTTRLFLDLSYELAATGRVRSRALEKEDDEDLLHLFQDFSKKLPNVALPSVVDNEDTYCHGVLDSLMSFFFPASDHEYHLSWANRPSQGSRERRGVRDANKPDCTIIKEIFDVAFAEIKAPKDDHSTRLYIQDKWALTSLAKDTIDLHLRERRTITSIYCLQVFGYQLAVYELRFQSGLYMWTEIGTGYLPRDKNDTHCMIRCMELLNTVKSQLDAIPVCQYVHTPPQRDPDDLLPEEFRPRPTIITPSSRRFFGCIVKTSTDTIKSN